MGAEGVDTERQHWVEISAPHPAWLPLVLVLPLLVLMLMYALILLDMFFEFWISVVAPIVAGVTLQVGAILWIDIRFRFRDFRSSKDYHKGHRWVEEAVDHLLTSKDLEYENKVAMWRWRTRLQVEFRISKPPWTHILVRTLDEGPYDGWTRVVVMTDLRSRAQRMELERAIDAVVFDPVALSRGTPREGGTPVLRVFDD